LDIENNRAFPLDLSCLECLSVQSLANLPYVVATQFATKKQLKDLTHMPCLGIPCHKLYKKGLFSYVFTLKYTCHFGMSSKKFNLKGKIKNIYKYL
jgi:hypothetical protein